MKTAPRTSQSRVLAAALATMLLLVARGAAAHEDPPGCFETGPAIIITVFRADGVTGVVGPVSQCETIKYRATLKKATNDDSVCAFSGGTFSLTTPDGVVHNISSPVPCIGGTTAPCDPTVDDVVSPLIPYTVQLVNVIGGFINASANYTGGVAHDNNPDSPGVSAGSPKATAVFTCNDNNPCTTDVCDPTKSGSAACSNSPVVCTDNNICTTDTCVGGQCQFNLNPPCDDNNLCTTDTCDPTNGCTFTPNPPCTDNNICTTDLCDPLIGCTSTPNPPCTDNNICTTDTCDPVNGCTFTPNAPCTDNNVCTTDTCDPVNGCTFTPNAPCTDNNLCTMETCDPVNGCVSSPSPPCIDNNFCTTDMCNPATGCVFLQNPSCSDNNLCTTDTCNPASGCVFTPNDPSACNDSNPCTTDSCDPQLGCIHTPTVGDPACAINHFQCYEVKPFGFTNLSGITVQDRYTPAGPVTLARPNDLCAPSDKNGEDPTAATDPDHLLRYKLKPAGTRVLNRVVTNQFGTLKLDLTRRVYLLVPTAKSLAGPTPVLATPKVDHFQCYKVKRSAGGPSFTKVPSVVATDQFGGHTFGTIRPKYLCMPANKNNEDPTAPQHPDTLLCYKVRHAGAFPTKTVYLNNQLGPLNGEILTRRTEFCVPSTVTP